MSETTVGVRGETIVHATALVDPLAVLGQGVTVGPWAIVGPNVEVGDGTEIGPRALLERDTVVGEDCRIANGAVLATRLGAIASSWPTPTWPTTVRSATTWCCPTR
jgi:UDP-3-O-[3-hydroxymyristoyl] glucosamine N-acyltransferase